MTTILIIEDDHSVLDNLEDILNLEDFDVITATNGFKGAEAAFHHLPDLILCDVMMPEMDGHEVVKLLRGEPKTHNIPFIFLTAKADRLDQRAAMELGADDYLTKPFRPDEVIKAIQARLERQAVAMQTYNQELVQTTTLKQQLKKNTELSEIKDSLLSKLSKDLREPLTNVNLALFMLSKAQSDAERDRYINILKQEYAREIRLLEDVDKLQEMVTPDNLKVLRQFNLLRSSN